MINASGILMIEPRHPASDAPIIDKLTRKMAAAFRKARKSDYGYRGGKPTGRGFHGCICGATSDNHDYFIGEVITNSLCVHYLAFHRQDVSESELAKVAALPDEEVEPTEGELANPQKKKNDGYTHGGNYR